MDSLTSPAPPAGRARPAVPSRVECTPRAQVLDLPVDVLAMDAVVARIAAWIEHEDPHGVESAMYPGPRPPHAAVLYTRHVLTLNPEIVMTARRQPALRAVIAAADLVVPDGMGIVWAARRAGEHLPQRVAGVDLLDALAARASMRGWRIFLLGAAPGVAEAAARALERRYPPLIVVGTHAGAPARDDDAETLRRIGAARPDLLFVAYGSPAQEEWIARLRTQLGTAVAIGVGGALDFCAGRVPRAPRWMQRAGIEWLYRLCREPWRWQRMRALPRFALAAALPPRGRQ